MKDEIKEILDYLRKTADNTIFAVCSSQEELDKMPRYTANFMSINDRKAKLLLDYITNLQEENERLKELCDKYEEEHNTAFKLWTTKMEEIPTYEEKKELQDRIDKAIEYMKTLSDEYASDRYDIKCDVFEKLYYEILQGKSDE